MPINLIFNQEAEDARNRQETIKRDFENMKEDERLKLQEEMDKLRHQFLTQLQDITIKNSTYESRFQNLESKNTMMSSLGDLVNEEDRQEQKRLQQEVKSLKEDFAQQQSEWKRKLKVIHKEHDLDRQELVHENERLKATLTNDQQAVDQQLAKQMRSLKSQLTDQNKLIKSQKQTIEELTRNKDLTRSIEVPQVILPVGAPPEEVSEDEDDFSLSQSLKNIEALRRDPDFIRHFRPILEQTLMEKLERLGCRKGAKGIPSSTFKNMTSLLATEREQKVRKHPEIKVIRSKLRKKVTHQVKQWRKNEGASQYKSSQLSIQQPSNQGSIPQSDQGTRQDKNRDVLMVGSQQSLNKAPVPSPRAKPFIRQNTTAGSNIIPSPRPSKESQKVSQIEDELEEESDWSDSEISHAKQTPRSVSFSKGLTNQGSNIQSLAKGLEQQLAKPRAKPVGGVETVKSQPIKTSKAAETLNYEEDSEYEFSSLEEITEHLSASERKPHPAVRQSAESTGSQGTSIWSSASLRAGGW
ncbi:hypothetical protein GDO86_010359 [Hymenochirus boettgeri]|uniref:Cilium assembly protein DZIP1 domain-containing protein n=1 Tax=Hymenochirus boettgeri TaxID=247094 RepID=A0A8T2JQ45_9PIPI|nr:hypothetical protein GDO86_010359 [Hymenochirus boettgeri]